MTDYRTQPINQKNADFVEQVADRIEEMQLEGRSLWQDAKRRFFRNKAAVASLIILAFIIVFITVAPWFFPFTYEDTDWNMMSSPPTWKAITSSVPMPRVATYWYVLLSVDVFPYWSVLLVLSFP